MYERSEFIFLHCLNSMYLGGDQGILIFQTQYVKQWSLRQSDITPDLIILSGFVTSIQSNKDDNWGSTLVGSFINWVKFAPWNKCLSFVEEWLSQLLLKSPKIINSLCFWKELTVDKIHFIESAGVEGGLYILPIVNVLFSWKIILVKRHLKLTGSTLGVIHLELRWDTPHHVLWSHCQLYKAQSCLSSAHYLEFYHAATSQERVIMFGLWIWTQVLRRSIFGARLLILRWIIFKPFIWSIVPYLKE